MRLTNFAKALNGNPNHANLDFYQNFAASFAFFKYQAMRGEVASDKDAGVKVKGYLFQLCRNLSYSEKDTVRLAKKIGYAVSAINDLKAIKKEVERYKVSKRGRILKEINGLDEDIADEDVFNYLACMFLAKVEDNRALFMETMMDAAEKELDAQVAIGGFRRQPETLTADKVMKCY